MEAVAWSLCPQNRAFPMCEGGTWCTVVHHFLTVWSLPLPTGVVAGKAPWCSSLSISLFLHSLRKVLKHILSFPRKAVVSEWETSPGDT